MMSGRPYYEESEKVYGKKKSKLRIWLRFLKSYFRNIWYAITNKIDYWD